MWKILLQGLKEEMSEFVFNVFKEKIRGIFLFREDTELKAWKQNSPNNHFCVTFLVTLLVVNWSKEKVTLSISILKINPELSQHESGQCCGSWRCWWCWGIQLAELAPPFPRGWGLHPLQLLQAGWCRLRHGRTAGCCDVNYCLLCRGIGPGGIDVMSEFSLRSARACSKHRVPWQQSRSPAKGVTMFLRKPRGPPGLSSWDKPCLCPVGSLIKRVPLHIYLSHPVMPELLDK